MKSLLPYSGRQAFRLIKRDLKNLVNRSKNCTNKQAKNDLEQRLSQVPRIQPHSSAISQVLKQQTTTERGAAPSAPKDSVAVVDNLVSTDPHCQKHIKNEYRHDTPQSTTPTSKSNTTTTRLAIESPPKTPSAKDTPHHPSTPTSSTELVVRRTRSKAINMPFIMPSSDSLRTTIPSISNRTVTTATHTRASSLDSATSTAPTEYQAARSINSICRIPTTPQSSNNAPSLPFSYEDADAKLNSWYKSRPILHPDRWAIRGVILVLTTAFYYSDSNPVFESIFGHSFSNDESSRNRLTRLFVSLYDDSYGKAIHETETLLKEIYPQKDEKALLRDIGDVRVNTENVKDDLRKKLARMLLPEFSAL